MVYINSYIFQCILLFHPILKCFKKKENVFAFNCIVLEDKSLLLGFSVLAMCCYGVTQDKRCPLKCPLKLSKSQMTSGMP